MLPFRLALLFLLIAASTVLHVIPLLAIALLKVVLPLPRLRAACNPLLTGLAASWIGFNNWLWDTFTRTRLSLRGDADLQLDGHYLVLANHQSWVDILVLQRCLQGRAPFLKFFIKRELIWVPLVGLVWWALDFPFLRRKGGASGAQDLATARAACARFRALPTSVMSFVEGTRFTPAKHEAQGSPYRHLLKPKAGGMMTALDVLGDRLDAVLDVTIFYPGRVPSFVDVLCGRVPEVRVHIDRQPVPATGDGQPLAVTGVQAWLAELWQAKDARFKQLGS